MSLNFFHECQLLLDLCLCFSRWGEDSQRASSKDGGDPGVWINGNYSQGSVGQTWPLKQGYNLIEITDYDQSQGLLLDLNYSCRTVSFCSLKGFISFLP